MENQDPMNAATLASVTTTLVFMQNQLAEIKADIKSLFNIFATKEEFNAYNRQMELRINQLEKSSTFWKIFVPATALFIGSVLTFLIEFYLSHLTSTH